MSERKRRIGWFWYILLILYIFLLTCKFEPVKTINGMYSASPHLVLLAFLISSLVGFALAFREGKVIRAEMISRREGRREKEAK